VDAKPEPGEKMKRLLPFLILALAGCPGQNVQQSWIDAERSRLEESVGPEYRTYYSNDATLTAAEKARRDRTMETWKADIDAWQAAVDAAGGK
jgi:hypothetical protein